MFSSFKLIFSSNLINKSISSQYPPGSTIKPFVALAALENGVSEKREVYCNGKHEIKDTSLESGIKTFHCWKEEGHGNVNMNEALKVSCDVYFYQISREIGINKIAEVCKRFGFGQNVFESFYEEKSGLTNNQAEYLAIIAALKKFQDSSDQIVIFSDSKNTVNQLNHEFAINNEQLRILAQESWSLIPKIPELKIIWIPRKENLAGKMLGS